MFTVKEQAAVPAKHGSCGDCRNFVFTYVERNIMSIPTTEKKTDHRLRYVIVNRLNNVTDTTRPSTIIFQIDYVSEARLSN